MIGLKFSTHITYLASGSMLLVHEYGVCCFPRAIASGGTALRSIDLRWAVLRVFGGDVAGDQLDSTS